MAAVIFDDMQELQWCDEFLPIKTEEEKAIEHISLILANNDMEVTDLAKDYRMFNSAAEALYKAGYRKQ